MNMNYTAIDGIRTVEDLKAEKNQPVGGGDLDRNAFLRLFTTQLQNQNPLHPMKNEAFVAQLAQFSTLEAMLHSLRSASGATRPPMPMA